MKIESQHNSTLSKLCYLIRQADQNKDGYLSKSELKYFLHPESYVEMMEVLVNETLEDHDMNGNGVIELEELKARGNTALFDEVLMVQSGLYFCRYNYIQFRVSDVRTVLTI